ncbi:MAG: SMC-Scp complex subunit ScpB [Gemmatimonadota bacterium]
METTQIVEALLFASDAPLAAADLARADEALDEERVETAIEVLRREYERTGRAFQIYEIAEGYQLLTRPEFASYLERFATVPQSGRLSGPALEALAVVAYRQPIGRAEIEEIRGVGSAGVLRTLQDRDLIEVVGRGEGLGRPLLYGTTRRFLEHFGLRSLEDLPRPDELPVVLTERAERSERPEEDDADEAGGEDGAEEPSRGGTSPDGGGGGSVVAGGGVQAAAGRVNGGGGTNAGDGVGEREGEPD